MDVCYRNGVGWEKASALQGEGVDMLSSLDDAALWDIELIQKTDGMALGSKALVRAAVPARCMTRNGQVFCARLPS